MAKADPNERTVMDQICSSKIQIFFGVILLLLLPFLSIFLRSYNEIVQMRKDLNPSYNWPEYSDLFTSAFVGFLLLFLSWLLKLLCQPIVIHFVSQKYVGMARELRSQRMVDSFIKMLYYIFSTCFAVYVLKDLDFFPASLGGSGSVENLFNGFPYQQEHPYLRTYIVVQLGFHFYSFALHLVTKPKSDFMETFLHHTLTLFLVALAYFMNYVNSSILVLLVHDGSDIFLHMTRGLVDSKYPILAFAAYCPLMVFWAYLRLYVLPVEIIPYSTYKNPALHEMYGLPLLAGMTYVLLLLHIYWFILLIRMGYRYIQTNEAVDIQQKFD